MLTYWANSSSSLSSHHSKAVPGPNFINVSTHRATLALQSLLVMSLFFNALMPLAATFAESGYVETLKDLQHLSSPGVRLAHFVTPC